MEQTIYFDEVAKATYSLAGANGWQSVINLLAAFGATHPVTLKVQDWQQYIESALLLMDAETAAPRSPYFAQQLTEEPVKESVSTALPPIAGLSFLPDVGNASHQVAPGHALAAKFG
jgi:hypothetical protein